MTLRLLCPRDFSAKNTRVDCHFPSPGDCPDLGIEPYLLLQEDSLSAEPLGKQYVINNVNFIPEPTNTGLPSERRDLLLEQQVLLECAGVLSRELKREWVCGFE